MFHIVVLFLQVNEQRNGLLVLRIENLFFSKQVREKDKGKLEYVGGKNKLKPTCLIRKEHLGTALPFQQVFASHESQ